MGDPTAETLFLPAAYDWLWTATVLLAVVAVVDVLRRRTMAPATTLAWTIVVLLLPLAGPVLWLAWGRRAAATSAASDS
ncbi:PLD nuclease N-terminal domain-containing protein [Puerhibacterium sp. TATVAM-FAB25]|uniref:PLD nuclease N-terminal domain-containing protein n=1 Tax=Puerhibacterium sp. TATVAM-FAB25 TaxID=3093699 RepID=UPI00397D63C6